MNASVKAQQTEYILEIKDKSDKRKTSSLHIAEMRFLILFF